MTLNGNFRLIVGLVSAVSIIVTAAVGYGTLKADVRTNTVNIASLKAEVDIAKTNAGATAAGADILGRITEINHRLDRIESDQKEILRILSRSRNAN